MKSEELRLGNFVLYDGGTWQARRIWWGKVAIHSQDDMYRHDDVSPDKITPIPLTEEWLVKFGFEVMPRNLTYHSPYFSLKYRGHNELMERFNAHPLTLKNGFEYREGNTHIQYVHQLQNLYFALTSEELTIKETTNASR